jgi:hypothetical protein
VPCPALSRRSPGVWSAPYEYEHEYEYEYEYEHEHEHEHEHKETYPDLFEESRLRWCAHD